MTLFCMYLEEDYKGVSKGLYYFDNSFNVEVEIVNEKGIEQKTFILSDNDKKFNLFNESINSVTCIVGKNGAGKTTFLELLITSMIWGLEEKVLNAGKMTLLYFKKKGNDINFFLQTYRTYGYNWNINYKNTDNKFSRTLSYEKNIYYNLPGERKWDEITKIPYEFNIIFHSLSPFDKIHTLLKQKLVTSQEQKDKYYNPCFRYIGIKGIESDEIPYEYQSINNLLFNFFDEKYKKILFELDYVFKEVDISMPIEVPKIRFNKLEFFELLKDSLSTDLFEREVDFIKYFDTYLNEKYNLLFPIIEKKRKFQINEKTFDLDLFKKIILLSNISLIEKSELSVFITLCEKIDNIERIKDDYNLFKIFMDNLDLNNFIFHIKNEFYISYKKSFLEFIIDILNIEYLLKITNFNSLMLKTKENEKIIIETLKNIKFLKNNGVLNFQLILTKPKSKHEVDYFSLSSGEKTFLTMFCNISAKIEEIKIFQNSDRFKKLKLSENYTDLKEKTFLIILDEVELHLHPEWQRKFILNLNNYFISDNKNEKYQFFIASHSPFIVSDLDNSQILYLGHKDNKEKTFGGNIFDIFKKDFYLDNSIGAFSETIIKELSESLYFISICMSAFEGNFFPLRDYIDEPYNNRAKKIRENRLLKKRLYLFLTERKDKKNYFTIIVKNNYFKKYYLDKNEFLEESNFIIDKIGDEVIRIYLKNLVKKIEFFKMDKYD